MLITHTPSKPTLASTLGRWIGAILFATMLLLPAPSTLSSTGWHAGALALLMAIWWMTEAVPMSVTSLLPLIAGSLLGIDSIQNFAKPYANSIIFLALGGFIIAIAMQRWNLHKRLALFIVSTIGQEPKSIILSFMLAAAFISMWVSNTATTLMLLPIAISIIRFREETTPDDNGNAGFSAALVLSVAYAASIGGMCTLIGTGTNTLMAGFMHETYHYNIGFSRWLMIGLPLGVIALPFAYWLLTRWAFPINKMTVHHHPTFIAEEIVRLGVISPAEIRVSLVFGTVAILWVLQPFLQAVVPVLSDAVIAMLGAATLFFLPATINSDEKVLKWTDLRQVPWGILCLMGGGMSLAHALNHSGLASWLGNNMTLLQTAPDIMILLITVLIAFVLTEFTSNVAVAAALLPIVGAVAVSLGKDPLFLVIPTALATSCAFMLPIATPPNAIVFASGSLKISQMVKTGLWLNLIFVVLIVAVTYLLVPLVFL